MSGRGLSCVVLLLLVTACGNGASSTTGSGVPADVAEPLVQPGHVVVLRADRSIAAVSPTGEVAAVLGSAPPDLGEPDGVAASADGRLVLVSAVRYDDDAPSTCSAQVLQVLPGEGLRRLADGASVSLTPDGSQLAYFRYAESRRLLPPYRARGPRPRGRARDGRPCQRRCRGRRHPHPSGR